MASKHTAVLRQYAESQLVRRHDVALYVRVGLPCVLRIAIQRLTYVQMLSQYTPLCHYDAVSQTAKCSADALKRQAGPATRQRCPSRCRSPSQEMVGPTSLTRPLRRLTKGCVQCIVFGQYDGRKGPRAELFMNTKYLYFATSMP